MDWIHQAVEKKVKLKALAYTVMNFCFRKNTGNFFTSWKTNRFPGRTLLHGVLVGHLVRGLVGWLVGWSVGQLVGRSVVWSVGWWVQWLSAS